MEQFGKAASVAGILNKACPYLFLKEALETWWRICVWVYTIIRVGCHQSKHRKKLDIVSPTWYARKRAVLL